MRLELYMNSPRSAAEQPSPLINHPNSPQWITEGLGISLQVPEGYDSNGDLLDNQARTIARLSMQIATERYAHERANVWKLSVATDEVVSGNELRQTYQSLAGKPEEIGAYVLWIAKVVTAAYDHLYYVQQADEAHFTRMARRVDGEENFTDIVLDIGGIRQVGYWEGTKELDAWAAGIGDKLREEEPSADVRRCTTAADQMRGYKLYRQYNTVKDTERTQTRAVQDEFSATVRRRRREAVVRVPGLRQLIIVKESSGWLHVDQIESPGIRDDIVSRLKNWDRDIDGVENSSVAKEAGRIFERAIAQRSEGDEITPLSTHYYVIASTNMPKVESWD